MLGCTLNVYNKTNEGGEVRKPINNMVNGTLGIYSRNVLFMCFLLEMLCKEIPELLQNWDKLIICL